MTPDPWTCVKSTKMVAMATTINHTFCVLLHKGGVYEQGRSQGGGSGGSSTPFVMPCNDI